MICLKTVCVCMPLAQLGRSCIVCLCGLMQNCVEQSFDSPPHVAVSKNTALSDNFSTNIQSCLAAVTAKLGTLSSMLSFAFSYWLSIVNYIYSS